MSRSPDPALSGGDLTNSDGATTVKSYLDVVASTVVATARINQTSFVTPLIQLSVDTTSGGWANNAPGMDVWIGSAAGLNDIGIYRLRDSQSNYILIGEVGAGDPGLLTPGIRNTSFADNQYVTIVNRYSPWSVLPLISQGVIYEDYGVLVSDGPANWNAHPPPLVSVKCTSTNRTEWNHIACFVDDGQTYATVVFLAAATLWPTSSSATYAWTAPGSWTVTGGATNTATFTARIPNSATNYVLDLEVTEDGGNISTRHIMVWVHTRTGANAPLTISNLAGDSWDRTGAKLTFTLDDDLLSNLPDGAMVNVWQEATFNGATISTAVDQFVGWITRINKRTEPGQRSAEPEFVGPAGILDFKRGTSQIFDVTTSTPATWQELPADLMSLSFAQFWLLSQRARGVLELFDFIPYSTAPAGQRLPELVIPPGNLWPQLNALADGIEKRSIGCDPDGSIWVMPHPSLVDYSSRSSIVKRDTLTVSRFRDVDWPREMFDKTSLVEGEGFIWDGVSVLPIPVLSIAPGFSMGQGGGDNKIQGQCVASQATLNTLTGNMLRLLNPDYPDLPFNINGNRGALYKPAQMQMVRAQIPASRTPEGVAFDRYFIPREVRRSYQGNGVVMSSVVGEVETSGVAGTTKAVPAANSNLYDSATIISAPTAITGGDAAEGLFKGSTRIAAICTDNKIYITSDFQTPSGSGGPTYTTVSLSLSGSIINFVVDAFSSRYLNTGTQVNGWITTTTTLYRITDIFGSPSVTAQLSFRKTVGAGVARAIDFSFGVQNWGVCVSNYDAQGDPVYASYTRDGVHWTAEAPITAFVGFATAELPAVTISSVVPGAAYTSAYTANAPSPTAAIYKTLDYGGSWVQVTGATGLAGISPDIEIPFNDNAGEARFYFGDNDGSTVGDTKQYLSGSVTTISPNDGNPFCPERPKSTRSSVINRQKMVMVGRKYPSTGIALFTSASGGAAWASAQNPTDYYRCGLAGNDSDTVYLYGINGKIGYSQDLCATIDDKTGNISTSGAIVGICGG